MKWIERIALLGVLAAATVVAGGFWYAHRPMPVAALPRTLSVAPGTTLRGLAKQLESEGVVGDHRPFWLLGRVLGKGAGLKAGIYTLDRALTPLELYGKIERGEVTQAAVQFIEGWNIREVRAALAAQALLRQDSQGLPDSALLQAIGADEPHPEGIFFPDTYLFAPHASDLEVLRRAYRQQRDRLLQAWESRAPGLPYRSPYEALIMASIIEKETGAAYERPMIAAVFVNRLRIGMRLQTDPTVIYGLGDAFDGNLRRADLERDTPYNTYTRAGLPPTPIAMPSEAAIRAALNPEASDVLYFVSRGDGTHVFSRNLDEHNRAVNRYQRGGQR